MESGKNTQSSREITQYKTDSLNYVMISVPLKNGGFYPVKVVQVSANVFKGPKGDTYYYRVPSADQLKQFYP